MIYIGKLLHEILGYQMIIKNAVTTIFDKCKLNDTWNSRKLKVLPKILSVRLRYIFIANADEFTNKS